MIRDMVSIGVFGSQSEKRSGFNLKGRYQCGECMMSSNRRPQVLMWGHECWGKEPENPNGFDACESHIVVTSEAMTVGELLARLVDVSHGTKLQLLYYNPHTEQYENEDITHLSLDGAVTLSGRSAE